jgi:hypothetical protein
MTSDNASSIFNFSIGEAVRAFLISSINCARSAESRVVRVVSYLDTTPTLDPYFCFRYGTRIRTLGIVFCSGPGASAAARRRVTAINSGVMLPE